ncbi:MAG: M14 family zinc carboxypeptidase, partial [Candidatus Methanofastidiosia archaeon]
FFQVKIIGKSVEGRDIHLVEITDSAVEMNKINLLLVARHHGNEPAGTEATLKLIKYMHSNPKSYANYLERLRILIVPMANPDGAELYYEKWESYVFKNGAPSEKLAGDPSTEHMLLRIGEARFNANEKDLNRQYTKPLKPLLEPETQAILTIFSLYDVDIVLDLHGMSGGSEYWVEFLVPGVLLDDKASYERDLDGRHKWREDYYARFTKLIVESMDERMERAGYKPTRIVDGDIFQRDRYIVIGGFDDYAFEVEGCIAFTMEIRDQGLGGVLLEERTEAVVEGFLAMLEVLMEQNMIKERVEALNLIYLAENSIEEAKRYFLDTEGEEVLLEKARRELENENYFESMEISKNILVGVAQRVKLGKNLFKLGKVVVFIGFIFLVFYLSKKRLK